MKFTGSPLELRAEDINPDPTQRYLYKSMMNSVIGKFSQRLNFPKTQYVCNAQNIEDLLQTGAEITDFQTISDDICEVQTNPTCTPQKNRKTNPIITAFVTSLSRIEMHQNILLLKKKNCCPIYTDTDSLIFTAPKNTVLPFELNGGVGYFKPEYNGLNGFCCIGKKSYAVYTQTKETETKVCGLSFVSKATKFSVSFDDFENFLSKNIPLQSIPQTRTHVHNSSDEFAVRKTMQRIRISTGLNFSRVLRNGNGATGMFTTPYGYNI